MILLLLFLIAAGLWVLFHKPDDSPEAMPLSKPFEVPKGNPYGSVYTYNGQPLDGIDIAEPFQLEVMAGVFTIKSIYTSTVWTGEGCLYYGRKAVGFIKKPSRYFNYLTKMSRQHARMLVWAKIVGYASGGWPEIKLCLPSYAWFEEHTKQEKDSPKG